MGTTTTRGNSSGSARRRCVASIVILLGAGIAIDARAQDLTYPPSRETPVEDQYHGTTVVDRYRWLEDLESPETLRWLRLQDQLTQRYLRSIPGRDVIEAGLRELTEITRPGVPYRAGDRFFFSELRRGQQQAVFYVRNGVEARERALIDPNPLSDDGSVGIGATAVSPDGNWVTYFLYGPWEDPVVRVKEVATGHDLESDTLVNTWFAQSYSFQEIAWTPDSRGFYYSARGPQFRVNGAPQYSRIWYHRLGTSQAEDRLVYEQARSPIETFYAPAVSQDSRRLVFHAARGSSATNSVYVIDLENGDPRVTELFVDEEASVALERMDGSSFWFSSNADAERGRLIRMTLRGGEPDWRVLVPERDATIQRVDLVGELFLVTYLRDQRRRLSVFDADGVFLHDLLSLPPGGTVIGLRDLPAEKEVFLRVQTLTDPGTVLRVDVESGSSELSRQATGVSWKAEDFEIRYVEFRSVDGVRVPMYLAHRKGVELNGENPVWLSGYGAFGVPRGASFAPFRMLWLLSGGVLAMPGTRGGGDRGPDWHRAGRGVNKQRTFDDAIAAAEWLIHEGYTSPGRIALFGFSAGSVIPMVLTQQRSDLFGGGIAANPIADLIRFPQFDGGARWLEEFGSPADSLEFEALLSWSPYHNIEEGVCHPRMLVVVGEKDATAMPAHGYKYVAALQRAQRCDEPILLWMDWGGGHGVAGKDNAIRYSTDALAFVGAAVDLNWGNTRE